MSETKTVVVGLGEGRKAHPRDRLQTPRGGGSGCLVSHPENCRESSVAIIMPNTKILSSVDHSAILKAIQSSNRKKIEREARRGRTDGPTGLGS